MGYQERSLTDLVEQIKAASENIERGDARTSTRLDGIEKSINELYLRHNRPGPSWETADDDEISARKSAAELCRNRRALTVPRIDTGVSDSYAPSSAEIDDALLHRKALRSLMRYGDVSRLDNLERKSLSSFSFGNSGFLLPPEMSNQVLRCIVDPSDVAGLVNQVNISAGSIKFLIDNSTAVLGGWACEASCWANQPAGDLQTAFGELEIKAESLRYVQCATNDLLADAAFNVEAWLLDAVSRGMRNVINGAILLGDGVGKPLGILNPAAGVPICDVSAATPPGAFTWQDLLLLKMEIPQQFQDGAVFLMNARTAALLFTMSDASARPLFSALPERGPALTFAGSPIIIVTWMPNVEPGSTPVLYGNLKNAYTMVNRKATTMVVDPYSAGYCTIFRFEARCGGATSCPNAVRLLRIK